MIQRQHSSINQRGEVHSHNYVFNHVFRAISGRQAEDSGAVREFAIDNGSRELKYVFNFFVWFGPRARILKTCDLKRRPWQLGSWQLGHRMRRCWQNVGAVAKYVATASDFCFAVFLSLKRRNESFLVKMQYIALNQSTCSH